MARKRRRAARKTTAVRRRPRRSISPVPWLWFLLIVNVAAGLAYSPATAVRRVRVEGAPLYDRERLAEILRGLRNVPCARVSGAEIETLAQSEGDVLSADLRRNPFGRATLHVVYRRPVATLEGHPGMMLSDQGVLYAARHIVGPLPKVRLRDEANVPMAILAGVWPSRAAATVCKRAFELGPPEKTVLDVDSSGRLCLNMDSGAQVVFGSSEGLDRKFAEVNRVLKRDPSLLEKGFGVNVTAPEKPVIVPPSPSNRS